MNLLVLLQLSLPVAPAISTVTTTYIQSHFSSLSISSVHAAFVFVIPVLDSFTILCFLSISRRGWQRSMSTPSRTWSSCCWVTRWDLVANVRNEWTDGLMEGGKEDLGGSWRVFWIYFFVAGKRDLLYLLTGFFFLLLQNQMICWPFQQTEQFIGTDSSFKWLMLQ